MSWRYCSALALFMIPGCGLGVFGLKDADRSADASDGNVAPSAEDAAPFDSKSDGAVPAVHDAGERDAVPKVDSSAPDAAWNAGDALAARDVSDGGSPLPLLLGAWSFEEGIGFSSADVSGNGHPAVFVGGAGWGIGKAGRGLALDGLTGYADIGASLVDMTKSFSVVAWAQFTRIDAWETVVSEDDVMGSLFGLKLRGDGSRAFDFDVETSDALNPGFAVAQSTSTARAGEWVHLASVYDADGNGRAMLYVNGVLESATSVVERPAATATRFVIGRGLYNGFAGSYLPGTIDEVAVYDGALSDEDVAALRSIHP